MYLCDHVPIDTLDRNTLYVAEGENMAAGPTATCLATGTCFCGG